MNWRAEFVAAGLFVAFTGIVAIWWIGFVVAIEWAAGL